MEKLSMNREPVHSSNIKSIGYKPVQRKLEVEFKSGDVYRYRDVSRTVHKNLMASASKGKYLAAHIKYKHPYRKYEDAAGNKVRDDWHMLERKKYAPTMQKQQEYVEKTAAFDASQYLDGDDILLRSRLPLDIRRRKINRSDLEKVLSHPDAQKHFKDWTNRPDYKVPKRKWNKDFLARLSYKAVGEGANPDYFRYMDDVADHVVKKGKIIKGLAIGGSLAGAAVGGAALYHKYKKKPIEKTANYLSRKDITLNPDSDKNLTFITGFSGSGKTTLGEEMEKESPNNRLIELDGFEHDYDSSGDGIVSDYVKEHGPVKVEIRTKEGFDEYDRRLKGALDYIKEIAQNNPDKRYIVEGIQILPQPELTDGYPTIVKGTGLIKSSYRRVRRPVEPEWKDTFSHSLRLNKDLNGYVDNMRKQAGGVEKTAANKMIRMINAGKISEKSMSKLLRRVPSARGLAAVNEAGHENAYALSKLMRNPETSHISINGRNVFNSGMKIKGSPVPESSSVLQGYSRPSRYMNHDARFGNEYIVGIPKKDAPAEYPDIPADENVLKELRGRTTHHEISGEVQRQNAIISGLKNVGADATPEDFAVFEVTGHASPDVMVSDAWLENKLSPSAKKHIDRLHRENLSGFGGEINGEKRQYTENEYVQKTLDRDPSKRFYEGSFSGDDRRNLIADPALTRYTYDTGELSDDDLKKGRSVIKEIMDINPWMHKHAALNPDVQLYPHQQRVVDSPESSKIIAHSVGGGKTLTAIAKVEKMREQGRAGHALVVAPASLRDNFGREGVGKFTNSKYNIVGNKQEIAAGTAHAIDPNADYNILSYEMYRKNPRGYLKDSGADTVITDEAHRGKNEATLTTEQLKAARPYYKNHLALTGSLISNSISDVQPLVDVVSGGKAHVGKSKNQFEDMYVQRSTAPKYKDVHEKRRPVTGFKNPHELGMELTKYIDYADYDDLKEIADMPDKKIKLKKVPISHEQARMYKRMLEDDPAMMKLIKQKRYETLKDDELAAAFSKLIEERKLMNSYGSVVPGVSLSESAQRTPKTKQLLDDVDAYLKKTPDGQAILMSQLVNGGTDVLEQGLKDRHIPYGAFLGKGNKGVTEESRQQAVRDYNDRKTRVMVVSPAGGEGLSLNDTTYEGVLDPHYNPEKMNQMEARGIRSGGLKGRADRTVRVNRYISTMPKTLGIFPSSIKTPDEFIYDVQENKDKQNQKLYHLLKEYREKN